MKRKYSPEEVREIMTGRIYTNPDDANIFVRRKSSGAWTMNLGNPMSWIIMGAIVFAVVVVLWIV